MSALIVEKVAEEIYKELNFGDNLNSENILLKEYYRKIAKAAIGALRNVPENLFPLKRDYLVWVKTIDDIGYNIATGK